MNAEIVKLLEMIEMSAQFSLDCANSNHQFRERTLNMLKGLMEELDRQHLRIVDLEAKITLKKEKGGRGALH